MPAAAIIEKIPDIQPEDFHLLETLFSKFDGVMFGFERFVNTTPCLRIPEAIRDLSVLPRTGWKRLIIPECYRDVLITHAETYDGPRMLLDEVVPKGLESVAEHSLECEEIYIMLYGHMPHRQLGQEVMKYHDIGEPICGDFTPFDDISKQDKKRLEWIAVNLLTEDKLTGNLHALHVYNCFMIYERDVDDFTPVQDQMLAEIHAQKMAGNVRPHQIRFVNFLEELYSPPVSENELRELQVRSKDVDLLQMAYRAHRIWTEDHSRLPKDEARVKLREFWDYIEVKLVTDEAKIDFLRLRRLDSSLFT